MDVAISSIIVAIITGVFSVIVLIVQKRQNKFITKIDQQTAFIEREKNLKQEITDKEKERSIINGKIMILILDTNLAILNGNKIDDNVMGMADTLKTQLNQVDDEIRDLEKQYKMLIDMTADIQNETNNKKK